MIGPITKTILLAATDVTDIVGGRVYVSWAPRDSHLTSYCLMQALPTLRGPQTSSGQLQSRSGQVVINCLATTDVIAYALVEAVQAAMLDAESTEVLGTTIKYMEVENYEPQLIETDGDESPAAYGYQVFLDYAL